MPLSQLGLVLDGTPGVCTQAENLERGRAGGQGAEAWRQPQACCDLLQPTQPRIPLSLDPALTGLVNTSALRDVPWIYYVFLGQAGPCRLLDELSHSKSKISLIWGRRLT